MSISNQSFKEYSFAHHGEVYKILDTVFRANGIDYYLIGANARDVAFYKVGEKPKRATADIDFAVMVPNHEQFDAVKEELKKHGFEKSQGNMPYSLFHAESKTTIDLLPFGGIEEERMVRFAEGNLELSAVGLTQVSKEIESFDHPYGIALPVTPAHGLVILKLIAWSEKPGDREKDLGDTANILRIAWALYEPEIFRENAEHSDLFEMENFDTRLVGARIMGRKMKRILVLDAALEVKINNLLNQEIQNPSSPLSIALVKALDCSMNHAKDIIRSLKLGVTEN
ncbi:hypothetical protein [Flagellimonas abyssi]|uniref:Nucleotidyltransferase n=1 Tax=Flagellimonas abyssi TaxID=2864871 RepID=A0ABS7EVL9_9FLAO|nr:hypothetical protein [Allomuricauda abyssi]MBW8201644.1 hypothetical protein [Allomuricauda abyssi]